MKGPRWPLEVGKILLAAAAITLASLWGTVLMSLLLAWGPLAFLRSVGAAFVVGLAILAGLAMPALLPVHVMLWDSREAMDQRRDGPSKGRHRVPEQESAPISHVEAPDQSYEERRRMHGLVKRQLQARGVFWLGVILVLGVESGGMYRLRPHAFAASAMAVALTFAIACLASACLLYVSAWWRLWGLAGRRSP